MKKLILSTALSLTIIGCATSESVTAPVESDFEFQEIVDAFARSDETVPAIAVALDSEELKIDWVGAVGVSDRETQTPVDAEQPWRIASITKTYTAAAIIRLSEQGKITLDDPIRSYLSNASIATLSDGGYDVDAITVNHLLAHTSGLPNYAAAPEFYSAVVANPLRDWTREEQVQLAMENMVAIGAPGDRFEYSDTGYILLGEMIARLSGEAYGPAMRKLLKYNALGLNNTWMELQEEIPVGTLRRVDQHAQGDSIYLLNPTMDLYGGGGLVASVSDIARFYEGLFENEIFDSPESLRKMNLADAPTLGGAQTSPFGVFGAGMITREISGFTLHYHGGAWGTWGGYVPALDLSFAIALSESEGAHPKIAALLESLLNEIAGIEPESLETDTSE